MKHWRDNGHFVGKTEHWNSFAKIRQDLFGFIDLIAVPDVTICREPVVAIQVTTKANASEHIHKIKARAETTAWLRTGNRIVLDAWHKVRGVWQLEQIEIEL